MSSGPENLSITDNSVYEGLCQKVPNRISPVFRSGRRPDVRNPPFRVHPAAVRLARRPHALRPRGVLREWRPTHNRNRFSSPLSCRSESPSAQLDPAPLFVFVRPPSMEARLAEICRRRYSTASAPACPRGTRGGETPPPAVLLSDRCPAHSAHPHARSPLEPPTPPTLP